MPSNLVIGDASSIGNSGEVPRLRAHYEDQWENFTAGSVSEIEEEPPTAAEADGQVFGITNSDRLEIPLASIKEDVAVRGRPPASSFDFGERGEDIVYVAVGKQGGVDDQTSMGALIWAIKDAAINPSSVVFLVHVFPETKYIPTPRNLPISRVNLEQKEVYMARERSKRRDFLQKFLNVCSAFKVKADTILIESEMEAKAILDLIPILNIRKLILGATKSTVRRMTSRKDSGVAHQILQSAPEFCEVKIICEGKEMCEPMTGFISPSPPPPSSPLPSPRRTTDHSTPRFGQGQEQEQTRFDSTYCGCFKL